MEFRVQSLATRYCAWVHYDMLSTETWVPLDDPCQVGFYHNPNESQQCQRTQKALLIRRIFLHNTIEPATH